MPDATGVRFSLVARRAWLRSIACLIASLGLCPAPALAADKAVEVGVLPNVSARVLMTHYEPMQQYLNRQLPTPVNISTAPDWREFYQRAKRGEYQVVVVAANVARLLERDLGFRSILIYQPRIPALLITRKGDNTELGQLLRGHTVAMANPASLVVFRGLEWLGRAGLNAGDQYQMVQVRRDDSVGNAVLRGESAAGILSMGEFKAHPAAVQEQLSIRATMAEVPSFVVSVAKELSNEQLALWRRHLLAFAESSEEGKEFFRRSGFRGMTPLRERELNELDAFVDKTRQALD